MIDDEIVGDNAAETSANLTVTVLRPSPGVRYQGDLTGQ